MRPGEEVKEGGWWEKKWRSGRRSEGVEEEVEEWKRKKRSGRKSEGVEEEVEELSLEIAEWKRKWRSERGSVRGSGRRSAGGWKTVVREEVKDGGR